MGELENLARELGDTVHYSMGSGIALMAYRDNVSKIVATRYPSGAKSLNYQVDITKLDFYLSHLKQLESDLCKRIHGALSPRVSEEHPTDGSQHFVCEYFPLNNFSEISDLIVMHKKIA